MKKVGEERIVEMTNKLCDKLLHGKDQHRDTASIALRTVVAQVAPSLAPSILVTLTPQMMGGISGQVSGWEPIPLFRLHMPQCLGSEKISGCPQNYISEDKIRLLIRLIERSIGN